MKINLKSASKLVIKKLLNKNGATVVFTEKENGIFIENGKKMLKISLNGKKLSNRYAQVFLRKIIVLAKAYNLNELHISFDSLMENIENLSRSEVSETLAVAFHMADFSFTEYKSKKVNNFIKNIYIFSKEIKDIQKEIQKGEIIGKEVNKCRELCNTPGGEMTPTILAKEAKKRVSGTSIKVHILDEREMKKQKMYAILGVAKGSVEKPRFIILEYYGEKKVEKPVVLVGKGVTYDSGGLSLKPSSGMTEMHLDMSGGGSVIHTIILAERLKIKKNIIGLIPAVENMPSGESYRPGDILRSMSGKTIEVLNTDGEGRIILADALTYAKKYKPEIIIDIATLTGAALVALGKRASAILSTDANLANNLIVAGSKSGDYLWEFPLWEEYDTEMKGTFGDIANVGKTPYGGVIQGAVFLKQFMGNFKKWAHIDIAPRMTATDDEFLSKGSVGAGVRFLVKYLELS